MTRQEALDSRRLREMKRLGLRYVGGKRDPSMLSEAMQFMIRVTRYDGWIKGVVFDRGANKDHGDGKRLIHPAGYQGEPVYWLRRNTWEAQ